MYIYIYECLFLYFQSTQLLLQVLDPRTLLEYALQLEFETLGISNRIIHSALHTYQFSATFKTYGSSVEQYQLFLFSKAFVLRKDW